MQIHRITARQALNHVGGDPYDYDLNIYRGCAHRCRYCFAIYSQEFLKPQAGETNFFEDIFIKDNIVELLERRLASPHWTGAVINIGGVTDSYQPGGGPGKAGCPRSCVCESPTATPSPSPPSRC